MTEVLKVVNGGLPIRITVDGRVLDPVDVEGARNSPPSSLSNHISDTPISSINQPGLAILLHFKTTY